MHLQKWRQQQKWRQLTRHLQKLHLLRLNN
jgi:hypothetical protein